LGGFAHGYYTFFIGITSLWRPSLY